MNTVRCPICDDEMPGPVVEYPSYPFCSARCRLIDLGRWLNEEYTVADKDDEDRSTAGESVD